MSNAQALVTAIYAPELDPLFWRSDRTDTASAWYGHVPFAHWIVKAAAPRCIVELGSHNGVSYAAFCRAVQRECLATRCLAIDNWAGDEQAGFYGEEVLAGLRAYHDQRFGAFSTLVRRTFDDALELVPQGSVDLLHIDGRHGYHDVRHDFETWRGKMSPRGVVLLHDTNVHQTGFGVWRLWSELQQEFPSFEFLHAHGLGVVAVGPDCPPAIAALTDLTDHATLGVVRERFAQLGERCALQAQVGLLGPLVAEREQALDAVRSRLDAAEAELTLVQSELDSVRVTLARTEQAVKQQETLDRPSTECSLPAGDRNASQLPPAAAFDRLLLATTWPAAKRLSWLLSCLPGGVRRLIARRLQRLWRKLTPHLDHLRQPLQVAAARHPAPPSGGPGVPSVCYISGEPDTPGTMYRVQRYAAACIAAGVPAKVLRLDDIAGHMATAGTIDILVIWRAPWSDVLERFIHAARSNGARVVFDVDDLMIDPALATTETIDGIRSQNLRETDVRALYARMQRTMLAADFCSASTSELAGHVRRFGKPCLTLPNGFDMAALDAGRMAARRRLAAASDGLQRLGYASGSRTHQRDFAQFAPSLPLVFRTLPNCRLVLFQANGVKLVEVAEFPELAPFVNRIEWRELVPLDELPHEIARFDVNLVPLQLDNPFCEAKSELKYFEAALAGVCTVASPVGAYARVIEHGVNGFLAATPGQWEATLIRLLSEPELRRQVAQAALNAVLWTYGPDRRAQLMHRVLAEWQGGPAAADAFVLELNQRSGGRCKCPVVPPGDVVFSADHLMPAEITVAVPLFNYAHLLVEALESVRAQTLRHLDLVIVDDDSTDGSLQTAVAWARRHAKRFNRIVVARNSRNAGLGLTRNAVFSFAETAYVLPLDPDNLLRAECCKRLLGAIRESQAAFVYPVIQEFGARTGLIGAAPYDPSRLIGGNYIDAMALVAKSAWCAAGGYTPMRHGWEDYDFWCAVAEAGLRGFAVSGRPLADYRVHDQSMLAQVTDTPDVKSRVIAGMERRHQWVSVSRPVELRSTAAAGSEFDAAR